MLGSIRVRGWRRRAVAFICTMAAATGGLVARPLPAGADGCLEPAVKEINVNQGLPHNNRQTPLVRGKTTLVKFYLSLNTCAPIGTSIQINQSGTSLDVYRVAANGTTEQLNVQNGSRVNVGMIAATAAFNSTTPSDNSTGDPIFKVPGWMLAPASTTAAYTIRFDVHLSYTTKVASIQRQAGTYTPANAPNPTATVAQRSGAIRVLAVPMGDASKSAESQFSTKPAVLQSSSALQALQNGFTTLGRILPVADGVDDLANTTSTAGIRWHLNQGMLDIGPNGLKLPADLQGRYCINGDAFTAAASKLDNFLEQWNAQTTGTAATADRVVGVIDSNISQGTEGGCLEGFAHVPSTHAFVRALHDTSYSSSDARDTGPVLAMELLHTVGLVVPQSAACPTCRGTSTYHSPSSAAAAGVDTNRGYNTVSNGYLGAGRASMAFVTPFTNSNTLLEQPDWADALCTFGGGASYTGLCPSTAEQSGIGTTNGVAAQARLVVTGLTDDKPENTANAFGTRLTDAFYSTIQQESANDPTSPYYFVAYAGTSEVRRLQVKVTKATSAHDETGDNNVTAPLSPCPLPYTAETCGAFNFAIDAPSTTDRYELWKGVPGGSSSTKLLTELKTAKPVVGSVNVTNSSATTSVALTNDANADETDPALSPDGQWLAFIRRPLLPTGPANCTELVVAHISGTTLGARAYLPGGDTPDASAASVSNPLPCHSDEPAQPAWRPDGRALAYVSGSTLRLVAFAPASNPDTAGSFGNTQDFAPCVSILNAGGACVTADTGIRRLSNVANPAWSQSTTWPGSTSPGYRIAFDADGLLTGGRDVYAIDPRDEPNATSSGPLFAPSIDVMQNAVEPSFSQAPANPTRLEYTQTGPSAGIGVVDATTPGSGVAVSTGGRGGSYGDRFIAVETTANNGTGTGDVALLDYNSNNPHPSPVAVVTDGADSSPSIAITADAGDPFGQRLVFERAGTTRDIRILVMQPSDKRKIVVEGVDDDREDSRASVFLNCNGQYNVLAAGVPPVPGTGTGVRFEIVVDTSWFVCGDTADSARVAAVITDEFQMSDRFEGGSIGSKPKAPSVAILTPGPGDSVRPSAEVPLVGTAKDAWDRELTGSSLVWRVINPSGQVVYTAAGQMASMPAPSNYLALGNWTVSLTATNQFGLSTETRSVFRVEPTPVTTTVDFDPNSLTVPIDTSGPPQITTYLTVASGDLSAIDPSTVRISQIDQYDVSSDSGFAATAWSGSGATGQAKFDKTYLTTWLYSKGIYGRLVRITITGNSGAAPGSIGFAGYDATAPCAHLQNQGATC